MKNGLKEFIPDSQSNSMLDVPATIAANGGKSLMRFMGKKILERINEPAFRELENKANLLRAGAEMQPGRFGEHATFGEPLDAATKQNDYDGTSRKTGTRFENGPFGTFEVTVENKPVPQRAPQMVVQVHDVETMRDKLKQLSAVSGDVQSAKSDTGFLLQLRENAATLPPVNGTDFVYTVTTMNGESRRTESPNARNLENYVKLGFMKSTDIPDAQRKAAPYLRDHAAITALPDGQSYSKQQIAELQAFADKHLPKGTKVFSAPLKGSNQTVAVFVGVDNQMVAQAMQVQQEMQRLETALELGVTQAKTTDVLAPEAIAARTEEVIKGMRIEKATSSGQDQSPLAEAEVVSSTPHCEKMQQALKQALQAQPVNPDLAVKSGKSIVAEDITFEAVAPEMENITAGAGLNVIVSNAGKKNRLR